MRVCPGALVDVEKSKGNRDWELGNEVRLIDPIRRLRYERARSFGSPAIPRRQASNQKAIQCRAIIGHMSNRDFVAQLGQHDGVQSRSRWKISKIRLLEVAGEWIRYDDNSTPTDAIAFNKVLYAFWS